jgi:hypothetical protein
MMYGGSLSSRRIRSRDDVSVEFCDLDLDHRLPTSTRGSLVTAAQRLAELGVRIGRYSGVEQVFAGGPACMAGGIEPSTCVISAGGSLTVASRTSGEPTTFAWANDRWRWSPYPGVTVEAMPRRMGAITVIDFVTCEGPKQRPAARFYLAPV